MVANSNPVTAAPARTSAQSSRTATSPAAPAGKGASPGGEKLPVQVTAQELERVVRKLSETLSAAQRDLNFRVDKGSGRTVITVVDAKTKEIIRQIPSEEVLALSEALEGASGLLDARA